MKNEGPIYTFDEMRTLLEASEPDLKDFFTQQLDHSNVTNRQWIVWRKNGFHCYLLASLNNTKINSFKFALTYYLDSVGTSNEGLNTISNMPSVSVDY